MVFASPYVFSDEASQMTTNNASLFSGVIGNMITDTQSAGSVIPEKEYTLSNLTVNALHAALLGLLVTMILPILLLAGGIVIFMVRRKEIKNEKAENTDACGGHSSGDLRCCLYFYQQKTQGNWIPQRMTNQMHLWEM